MAVDQAHEQCNALVKGDGGAIGITEHESALLRWMTAGPELCRVAGEFEEHVNQKRVEPKRHHEDTLSSQARFFKEVHDLSLCIEDMGNPFLEASTSELLTLDTKDVMPPIVTEMLRNFLPRGKLQLEDFIGNLAKFYNPIPKNKFTLFATALTDSKDKASLSKQSCSLFSNLFIACQIRQVDLEKFFEHENQTFPPALSTNGTLYVTQKSELMNCLESTTPSQMDIPAVDSVVVDGSYLTHITKPTHDTFEGYATDFAARVDVYAKQYSRTDIVLTPMLR